MSLPVATDLDPTRKADLPISTETITTTGDADLDRIRDQVLTAAESACEKLAKEGVKIPRPAGPMAHGGSVIAFIEDPDGYKIEFVQRKPAN